MISGGSIGADLSNESTFPFLMGGPCLRMLLKVTQQVSHSLMHFGFH